MALILVKPSYKSELLNNISNSNAALLFRKCGILFKKKKALSYSGGAASHIDLSAEGDVRPPATIQQHYICISFQMA